MCPPSTANTVDYEKRLSTTIRILTLQVKSAARILTAELAKRATLLRFYA